MKNEQIIANRLLSNSKYSKEWIEQALWYILNNVSNEAFLSKFDAEQLKSIKEVIETPYAQMLLNPEFNTTQTQLIVNVIKEGFRDDIIRTIADPEIPYQCMDYIAQGYLEGLSIPEIKDYKEFDPKQCYEILEGFRSGIHYTSYAYPNVPAPIMAMIRIALENGYSASYNIKSKSLTITIDSVIRYDENQDDNPEEDSKEE